MAHARIRHLIGPYRPATREEAGAAKKMDGFTLQEDASGCMSLARPGGTPLAFSSASQRENSKA
jgi:hypothetical protein